MTLNFRKPKFELVADAPFGLEPGEILSSINKKWIHNISQENKWRLVGLVLELSVDSETPVIKLLECQPVSLNIDKLEKRKYILSGSLQNFREFYQEYKDQKLAKALLVFLCEKYRTFFEDLWPKHGILPPFGISFRTLSPEEVSTLELPIKMRHYYVLTYFSIPQRQVCEFLKYGLTLILLEENIKTLVIPKELSSESIDIIKKYLEFLDSISENLKYILAPQAIAYNGFLFAPLISYMTIFTRILSSHEHPLQDAISGLLSIFKEKFSEPFSFLPD